MKFVPIILDVTKEGEIIQARLDKSAFYKMKIIDVVQAGNDVIQILQLMDGPMGLEVKK